MTQLESALRTLAEDPLGEPAPSDLADRALARARQRSRRHGAVSAAGAAAVATLLVIGVTTVGQRQWWPAASDTGPAASASPPPAGTPFAESRQNVLLIGSDSGPSRIGVRPDTIMLASIDTATGATTLFSLPRNLQRVPFPAGSPGARAWPDGYDCGSECLLNTVWAWAEQSNEYRGDRSPGLTATTQVVEEITGLSVNDTVVVTMTGLADLVDAVGGVEVTVRERLPIGGSPNDPRATGGYLEKGKQHLNGEQALWFARSRWSTDDYDRIKRQQCLITALVQQVDARTLISRYPQIAKALGRGLSTSLRPGDLVAWASVAGRLQDARITRIGGQLPGGSSDPDLAAIRRLVSESIAASPAASPSGTVKRSAGDAARVHEGAC